MARRGILDYVLGGAVGGLEGLSQQRAAEDEKKRLNEALARQQGMDAMDRARFLRESGYRVAPPAYGTEDPAARSVLPPLEMPSAAQPSGARASGALSAALNRGMGVDTTQPSMSRPGFGAAPLTLDSKTTRMTDVLSRGQEARAAQEAIAASVELPGGMGTMRFNAPESAAQIAKRKLDEKREDREFDRSFDTSTADIERTRMKSVYAGAYPKATEQQVEALASGINPEDIGLEILTPSQVSANNRQQRLDALDVKYKNAQIEAMKAKGDSQKEPGVAELARLSEASANARTAEEKMSAIETNWLETKPVIGAMDVGAIQELMEGKGMSLNKALAAVWGSAYNPASADPKVMQQLQDYMSYAKMHSTAIRMVAARGGSNLLQQAEQQLVNAAWAGGDAADIERARQARLTINSSLEDALEASGISIKLRKAAETRKPLVPSPTAQPSDATTLFLPPVKPSSSASSSYMSFDEYKKSRGQ